VRVECWITKAADTLGICNTLLFHYSSGYSNGPLLRYGFKYIACFDSYCAMANEEKYSATMELLLKYFQMYQSNVIGTVEFQN
jgi:hypothetical protein